MQKADGLVVGQALALAATAWPGPARWRLPTPLSVASGLAAGAGAALACAGLLAHGRRITPRVAPPAGAVLLTEGPYALSRHPVYAGLLLGAAGWVALRRRPEPVLAWVVLAAVLHVKSGVEERRLREHFGDAYTRYADRTPRLLGLRPR